MEEIDHLSHLRTQTKEEQEELTFLEILQKCPKLESPKYLCAIYFRVEFKITKLNGFEIPT
jgi:hypothetical protein